MVGCTATSRGQMCLIRGLIVADDIDANHMGSLALRTPWRPATGSTSGRWRGSPCPAPKASVPSAVKRRGPAVAAVALSTIRRAGPRGLTPYGFGTFPGAIRKHSEHRHRVRCTSQIRGMVRIGRDRGQHRPQPLRGARHVTQRVGAALWGARCTQEVQRRHHLPAAHRRGPLSLNVVHLSIPRGAFMGSPGHREHDGGLGSTGGTGRRSPLRGAAPAWP
jgi:hypothetical protein